jgi:carbonic anhydrase
MLENIHPAVRAVKARPGDEISSAISENAILTAEKLRHEPVCAPLVASHQLKIVAARYHLKTGKVELLEPDK